MVSKPVAAGTASPFNVHSYPQRLTVLIAYRITAQPSSGPRSLPACPIHPPLTFIGCDSYEHKKFKIKIKNRPPSRFLFGRSGRAYLRPERTLLRLWIRSRLFRLSYSPFLQGYKLLRL